MLKDKIIAAARAVIEQQEGRPATVKQWRLVDIRHGYQVHQIFASVQITTEKTGKDEAFEVWVVVDLDTEKVECLE